jgi:hypothetical protein
MLGIACLLGLWDATRRDSPEPRDPRWRFARWPALVCASAILLVVALQSIAPP